jgi:hypothetical protein
VSVLQSFWGDNSVKIPQLHYAEMPE